MEKGKPSSLESGVGVSIEKSRGWIAPVLIYALSGFGIVWIFLFPAVTLTTSEAKPRGTFFDENALLVHHTMVELGDGVDWAHSRRLKEAVPQDDTRALDWVCNLFHHLDLPCYTHSFYVNPVQRLGLRKSVYTVLEPASGADGKECMIVTTAHDLSGPAKDLLNDSDFSGISLSVAALKHLKDEVGWLAKNVILLVADERRNDDKGFLHPGVKAFVDDYHADTMSLLARRDRDSAHGRAVRHMGVMRAAISLDFPRGEQWSNIQVLTSGFNGELPNMDLLNTAVYHLGSYGVGVTLDTCSGSLHTEDHSCSDIVGRAKNVTIPLLANLKTGDRVEAYMKRLFSMLGFMGSLAMRPSGPHAHFLRHSVDAITIAGHESSPMQPDHLAVVHPRNLTTALLNIVRGMSNLEEELHHSFFCYIMLSTQAFVSIGEYAYALGLLLLPLALQAGKLVSPKGRIRLLDSAIVLGCLEGYGLLAFGAALASPPHSISQLNLSMQCTTILGWLLVLVLVRARDKRQGSLDWEGPKAANACLVLYALTVTALLNWPLSLIIALTHVPILMASRPWRRTAPQFWCMLAIVGGTSPVTWLWWLEIVTGSGSDGVMWMQWLRGYQSVGLMNLPLLCLISIPTHLITLYVLLAQ